MNHLVWLVVMLMASVAQAQAPTADISGATCLKLLTGKDGLGYGDFKLLAMIGAWGGIAVLPLTLLLASLTGAVVGVFMLALRHTQTTTQIPFAPYLAIAGWIALLWSDQITTFYWQLSS